MSSVAINFYFSSLTYANLGTSNISVQVWTVNNPSPNGPEIILNATSPTNVATMFYSDTETNF